MYVVWLTTLGGRITAQLWAEDLMDPSGSPRQMPNVLQKCLVDAKDRHRTLTELMKLYPCKVEPNKE